MKHVLIAAVLLSLGGVAAGCGDDDSTSSADAAASASSSPADTASDAPTDASASDLCKALTAGATIKDGADVADFADGLQQAGTPSQIPDTARKGFEVYLGVLQDVDPEATAKDLQNMKQVDLSKTEQAEVQTFMGYAQQTCAPAAPSGGAGN